MTLEGSDGVADLERRRLVLHTVIKIVHCEKTNRRVQLEEREDALNIKIQNFGGERNRLAFERTSIRGCSIGNQNIELLFGLTQIVD